ncbi:MAG: di-trans,poly-cis-decaprenylcistransferase [Chlamydiales bacterium]|nr:polyprenyl diphosphate synthase [Chlamydiales bacterium]NCF70911.1 di-trans,poly-cis-decaprenylcistransferase [Chlamydiales bacterium]
MTYRGLSSCEETTEESKEYYSQSQLSLLDSTSIPQHVAIIMDGNRRWAMQQGLILGEGHHSGARNLIDVVKAAKELGIKVLTVYGLSTENLKNRNQAELDTLFQIFVEFLTKETPTLLENDIRFHAIGELSQLSDHLNHAIAKSQKETANCREMDFVVALNYGSRDEMTRAVRKVLEDFEQGKLTKDELTEDYIASKLDTGAWPDPDVLIRTSGEKRISNFLLWQISYAEFISTKTLWPDFSPDCLLDTLVEYQKRERRLGD